MVVVVAVYHSIDEEQSARVEEYAGEGTRCRGWGLPYMTKAVYYELCEAGLVSTFLELDKNDSLGIRK